MDPISTAIITALVKSVVGETYQALKTLLKRKYGADSDLIEAMDKLEKKPDSEARRTLLAEEVGIWGADKDTEILKIAAQLIGAIKAQPGGEQAIQQTIEQHVTGDHNIFSGSGHVTVKR